MNWDELDEINEFIDLSLLLKDKKWFFELLNQKKTLIHTLKYGFDSDDIYNSHCGWIIFNWNMR